MKNDIKIIEEIIKDIEKISKEDLAKAIKMTDEEFEKKVEGK